MGVITAVVGRVEGLPKGIALDLLPLTSEQRAGAHFAAVTGGGRRLRISLPRGTELADGDVLALDGNTAVVVQAAPEELYVVRPRGEPLDWAVVGYQLGNLHRPVRFGGEALLTPVDPMVAELLRGLGVPFEQAKVPFVGRRYGAFTQGHHHHDDHAHPHHHDHEHAHPHRHG